MGQFTYAPVHNTDQFEVLFKPDRKWDKMHNRRFALCFHEKDAKLITAAVNKWCDEGGSWIGE